MAARISSNRLRIEKDEPGSGLVADEHLSSRAREKDLAEVARAQDALRRKIGPIGTPVRELIDEGRG